MHDTGQHVSSYNSLITRCYNKNQLEIYVGNYRKSNTTRAYNAGRKRRRRTKVSGLIGGRSVKVEAQHLLIFGGGASMRYLPKMIYLLVETDLFTSHPHPSRAQAAPARQATCAQEWRHLEENRKYKLRQKLE